MHGYVEVTQAAFFATIGGPENIHPTPHQDRSEWKNLSTHEVVGRTEPGYKRSYGPTHRYWLTESFAKRKQVEVLSQGESHE